MEYGIGAMLSCDDDFLRRVAGIDCVEMIRGGLVENDKSKLMSSSSESE